jgi:hypothetical protein
MDLESFLTHEIKYLKKEEMGTILGPDQETFNQLFLLSVSRKMPVCWRAAWLMDYLAELHPWLAEGYIVKVWPEIPNEHPVGVTRSWMRMLCRYEIPEDFQGIAADLCMNWLEKESVTVAIKAYSMEILLKIAKIYPELSNEFITILEDQAPNNSAGFKARATHVIGEMKKLQVA